MTSTCNILNSFGNREFIARLCQVMNTTQRKRRDGGGGVRIDGWMFLTPCLFDPLLLFSTTFIEKT